MDVLPLPAILRAERTTAPGIEFREPRPPDGPLVHGLVAACPPLDPNSLYCNLLQCTQFAATCVVAVKNTRPVGWVSAHLPPDEAGTLFVWQVAVATQARGQGLARDMIVHLLQRRACAGVRFLTTTITPDNGPSWALFRGVAAQLGAAIDSHPWLLRDEHFAGAHDTEYLVRIGPFRMSAPRARRHEPKRRRLQ